MLWYWIKSRGEAIGIPLVILGLLLIFAAFIFALTGLQGIPLLEVGLGSTSVGLGFIAMGIATNSDRRMEAMADLHFDEKLVVMRRYHAQPGTSRKDVLYDARAALRMAHWAGASTKRDFRNELTGIIQVAQSANDAQLVRDLQDLWQLYGIDKW
jgi:hypothetical protein